MPFTNSNHPETFSTLCFSLCSSCLHLSHSPMKYRDPPYFSLSFCAFLSTASSSAHSVVLAPIRNSFMKGSLSCGERTLLRVPDDVLLHRRQVASVSPHCCSIRRATSPQCPAHLASTRPACCRSLDGIQRVSKWILEEINCFRRKRKCLFV